MLFSFVLCIENLIIRQNFININSSYFWNVAHAVNNQESQ